jgi:hypothetical protein
MRIPMLILCLATYTLAQDRLVRFDPNQYSDSTFTVTQDHYQFGHLQIQVIQVRRRHVHDRNPFDYCRAWLNVLKNNKVTAQKYFPDFEPVGSYFGLFVPNHQLLQNFFSIVKLGDYDGRLLLIDKNGTIREYYGGAFLVTPDKKYLFSHYASDLSALEVIDATNGKSLGRRTTFPEVAQWYSDKGQYFFSSSDQPDSVYTWNSHRRVFQASRADSTKLQTAIKLHWDFVPPENYDCGCND